MITTRAKVICVSLLDIMQHIQAQINNIRNVSKTNKHAFIPQYSDAILKKLESHEEFFKTISENEENVMANLGLREFFPNEYSSYLNKFISNALVQQDRGIANFDMEYLRIENARKRTSDLILILPLLEDRLVDKIDVLEGEVVLELYFKNGYSPNNFAILSENTKKWKQIFEVLGEIVGNENLDVRILEYENGSLKIKIATCVAVATMLGKIVSFSLDCVDKVASIKKSFSEIEKNISEKEMYDNISKNMEVLIEREEENISEKIYNKIIDTVDINDGELKNRLKTLAIKNLVDFTVKGGEVKLISDNANYDGISKEELDSLIIEYKNIEKLSLKYIDSNYIEYKDLKDNKC